MYETWKSRRPARSRSGLLHYEFYSIDFHFTDRALRDIGRRSNDAVPRMPSMKRYMCLICGWIYDEAVGSPEEGIPPGTKWEDLPPNWSCPECGARKEDFEMIEI